MSKYIVQTKEFYGTWKDYKEPADTTDDALKLAQDAIDRGCNQPKNVRIVEVVTEFEQHYDVKMLKQDAK